MHYMRPTPPSCHERPSQKIVNLMGYCDVAVVETLCQLKTERRARQPRRLGPPLLVFSRVFLPQKWYPSPLQVSLVGEFPSSSTVASIFNHWQPRLVRHQSYHG